MVLCFKKPLSVVGLGPLLPSAFSVLKIKMGQKKWRVSRLIIKSEDLISFKSILWETATHQCQLCLLLESIIFLKSYLILWKCNLYNINCKQTKNCKHKYKVCTFPWHDSVNRQQQHDPNRFVQERYGSGSILTPELVPPTPYHGKYTLLFGISFAENLQYARTVSTTFGRAKKRPVITGIKSAP